MNKLLCLLTLGMSFNVFAISYSGCDNLLNNGFYKKYKYRGIDQPATKATKQHGTFKATFVTSTEASTASLDPKYWSNVTTSNGQITSSTGPCSLFALDQIKANRDLYYAQNRNVILDEISMGRGEHLVVLSQFALCDKAAEKDFVSILQKNVKNFYQIKGKGYGVELDSLIEQSENLYGRCHSFNRALI